MKKVKKSSILDETRNFLDLYHQYCGVTEVPKAYHTWSCLALLAACAGDRLWFEKMPGDRINMNMYTILLGPSAVGKGEAIKKAMKFLRPYEDRVNLYQGKATAAYLIEEFSGRDGKDGKKEEGEKIELVDTPQIVLVTPELSMSVGHGTLAMEFIKFMTALYEWDDYTFREGTRTNRHCSFRNPNVNWISGSTISWFIESVTQSAIESGFLGRTVVVDAKYNLNYRIARPMRPSDYDVVREYLEKKVRWFLSLEGQWMYSNSAWDLKDDWYRTRPSPTEEFIIPSWKRQDDLVIKISMVLALAELKIAREPKLLVRRHNVADAITLVNEAQRCLPALISYAAKAGHRMSDDGWIEEFIRKHKSVRHSLLLRKASSRGIRSDTVWQVVKGLKEQGMVNTGGRPIEHEWIGAVSVSVK